MKRLWLYLVLAFADVGLTWYGLSHGGKELNPFALWMWNTAPLLMPAIKIAFAGWLLWVQKRFGWTWPWNLAIIVHIFVVANNTYSLVETL